MTTVVPNAAGGNWSAGGTWVGGVQPTAAQDVDYSTLTGTLTIDGTSGAPNLCRSFTATASTGTLVQASAKQLNIGDGTTGHFKIVTGLTYAPNSASLLKFVSTTTGNQITFAGKVFGPMTFDGVGGAWQFQDANSMAAGTTITLTNGALDTNSQTQTNGLIFSSNNSNTRSLTLGTTNFKTATNSATVWNIATSTGMTLSAASSTITMLTTTGASVFAGGGLTYNILTATALTTGTITLGGANTFATLTLSKASGAALAGVGFLLSANQTVTGTFTSTGFSLTDRNFLASDTFGTARTVSAGTFAITNTDLRDITKAGAGSGTISATSSTSGNGDCGGNTGWTFQTTRSVYMKTAVSVSWSAANWYTTSGGSTPAVPPIPLCHDTAVFDANSVTAGSRTITLDMARISGFTFAGVLNTPALSDNSAEWEVYGSAIFVSGMTHTTFGQLDLMGRGSLSYDGGTLAQPGALRIQTATGTCTLARALVTSGTVALVSGTLALNGFSFTAGTSFTNSGGTCSGTGAITCGTNFTQNGGTTTLGGTLTLAGAFSVGGGTLNMNGNQVTGHTTADIQTGGTLNLSGQLNGSGAILVSGGIITDAGASGELKGTTCSFTGGTSAIRKLTLSSTFAISSTANLTLNPGTYTYATSWTETGTTKTFAINGTLTQTGGVKTVTAASSGGSFTFGS